MVIILRVSMDEFLLQFEFSASLHFFIFQRRMLLVLTASSAMVGKVLCIQEIEMLFIYFSCHFPYQIISKSLLQYSLYFIRIFLDFYSRTKVKTCEKKICCGIQRFFFFFKKKGKGLFRYFFPIFDKDVIIFKSICSNLNIKEDKQRLRCRWR